MKIQCRATLTTKENSHTGDTLISVRRNKIILKTQNNKEFARYLMDRIRKEMRATILRTVYNNRPRLATQYTRSYSLYNFIPTHTSDFELYRERVVILPDMMQFYRNMPKKMFIDRKGYNPYVMAKILFHTFNSGWTTEGYEKQAKTRFVYHIGGKAIPAGMNGTFFWDKAIEEINKGYYTYRKDYLLNNVHLKVHTTVDKQKISSRKKAKIR